MENSVQRSLAEAVAPATRPEKGIALPSRWTMTFALLLAGALVWEGATRPSPASPDAYQYLDVATNLANDQGLVQSVPGYNAARFPVHPDWPQAYTSQPPLYPWLGSLAMRAGFEPTAALAVIAVAGL